MKVTIDYAPPRSPPREPFRPRVSSVLIAVGVLIALASPFIFVGLPFFGQWYAGTKFKSVRSGMTRAQVDRELWLFNATPSKYQDGPAVSYHFLCTGKFSEIKVTFDANGRVDDAIPSFDN